MSEIQLITVLYLLVAARALLFFAPKLLASSEQRRTVQETLDSVVVAGVAALLLITFVVRSFYIPSASMVPTLRIQDYVLVNELIYRVSSPMRGDIVVFRPPHDPARDYIKRVVGIEGDVLEVKEGRLFRNSVPIDEPYTYEPEILGDQEPVRVPAGRLFVMGDNRNNSSDSRVWGFLPVNRVVGRASLIFWPPNRVRLLRSPA
ncbi:MAG: signal peptidase I [Armatimonadetes bacterium]|nr:signal peptidase I [Armatimonadota bacterium]